MTTRRAIEEYIRLKMPELRQVSGAADLKAVFTSIVSPPAVYVIEAGRTPKGPEAAGKQVLIDSYSIVVVVENLNDPAGGDGSDACRLIRDQITTLLVGWRPGIGRGKITYAGGSLVKLDTSYICWQETYKTSSTT